MQRRDWIAPFIAPAILAAAAFGIVILAPRLRRDAEMHRETSQVAAAIRNRYVEEVEPDEVRYSALEGMADALDRYSDFYRPDWADELRQDNEGKFGGLGFYIIKEHPDSALRIDGVIEGYPAFEAGILADDRILSIDGISTKGLRTNECARLLKGEVETSVRLEIYRSTVEGPWEVTVIRAEIKRESIKGIDIIDEKAGIGYVRIIQFQENTPNDFDTAIVDLKEMEMRSLILDLRSNPGGVLSGALDMAGRFLQEGDLILRTVGRDSPVEYLAEDEPTLPEMPVVVLVNQGSASASEIVAGAIQDHRRGLVLGGRTFGKGSVQSMIKIGNEGSILKLTTSKYQTPSGRVIHRDPGDEEEDDWGLLPDIPVALLLPDEVKDLSTEERVGAEMMTFHEIRTAWTNEERGRIDPSAEEPPPDRQLDEALRILREPKKYSDILDGLAKTVSDADEKTAKRGQ